MGIRQIYFLLIVKPRLQAAISEGPSGLENSPEVTFFFSAPILGVGCFCRRKVHNLLSSLRSMSGSGSNRFYPSKGKASAPTPWFCVQFYDQN